MNKVSIIIRQEFRQKLRSKAFIIMTLLAPALLGLTTLLPVLLSSINNGDAKRIVVIDQTKRLGRYFSSDTVNRSKKSRQEIGGSRLSFDLRSVILHDASLLDSLKKQLESKQIEGYFNIPPGALADTTVVAMLGLSNTNDFSVEEDISSRYEEALFVERLRYSGIDPNLVRTAQSAHRIETMKVEKGQESSDHGIGFAAGYICGFFIYFSMILYGSLIMQSVIEEKSTRVIELLASSVRPLDILIGKVIGVGLAGLVQVTVWALMFAGLAWFGLQGILLKFGSSLTMTLDPTLFIYFVIYFLFGYLIFATLYAGAGATVEQASEASDAADHILDHDPLSDNVNGHPIALEHTQRRTLADSVLFADPHDWPNIQRDSASVADTPLLRADGGDIFWRAVDILQDLPYRNSHVRKEVHVQGDHSLDSL
jgi:ABC-2 type transport system permease protein